MRNPTLHGQLEAFTADSATRLSLATADGDEIPFEVVQTDGGRVPLYCYRPLTSAFIRSHLGLLVALPTYAPAARALEDAPGLTSYLRVRGERRIPETERGRADVALRCFLARVFEERSEFGFDDERFRRAYEEIERSLYDGRSVTEVLAPILGVELDPDTDELTIGDGLSLMRVGALADPPDDADDAWEGAAARSGPRLLMVLRVAGESGASPPVALARSRFARLLTALRLFEPGGYSVGPVGWTRVDDGAWTPIALGIGGRPGSPARIPGDQEDELRAFCNLIARRLAGSAVENSGAGELAWALRRFEMGCERTTPLEALTDYLIALRALLEPEGPASGRLPQRLAVICAPVDERAVLAERTARATALERAFIAGVAPAAASAGVFVDELGDHLRAILRDMICGHLGSDLCLVADELLADAAVTTVRR